MALYIIVFFPSMDADSASIIDQVSKNQFSGEMVITLTLMIIIMIIDRYIYKSKSFVEDKDEGLKTNFKALKNDLQKHVYEEILVEERTVLNFQNHNHSAEFKRLGLNLDEMLAKTKIEFRSVMKLYF